MRRRERLGRWWDFLLASDPGQSRLIQALEVALAAGASIAAEYGFAQLVHPLWVTAPAGGGLSSAQAAALSSQHHGVTLLAMLLGGILALLSTLAVSDTEPRAQAITLLGAPVAMLGTMAAAIALAGHQAIGLTGLTLVIGVGTYVRRFVPRFGPRVVFYGTLLFMGYFFGFLSAAEIPLTRFYWVVAIVWLAMLVNLVLRVAVYNRVAAGAAGRARRSFTVRAGRAITAQ